MLSHILNFFSSVWFVCFSSVCMLCLCRHSLTRNQYSNRSVVVLWMSIFCYGIDSIENDKKKMNEKRILSGCSACGSKIHALGIFHPNEVTLLSKRDVFKSHAVDVKRGQVMSRLLFPAIYFNSLVNLLSINENSSKSGMPKHQTPYDN